MSKTIYKKNLLSLVLAFTMIVSSLPMRVFAAEGALSGEGTDSSPYLIEDAADLKAFRDLVNEADSSTAYAKLTNDIDLKNEEWTPFNSASGYPTTAYAGTFDGDYHTISGLSINSTSSNQGLFGMINGATIKNLKVEGSVESSNNYIGGIVGKVQQGKVENCGFSGSVITTKSGGYAGGITGYAGNSTSQIAEINNCFNTSTVKGETRGTVGGIVGYAKYTTISNSYNTGDITGAMRSGGIAGQLQNNCTASNSYNIGTISGSATASDICDFLYSSSKLENCCYITNASGAGTGTTENCEEITTTDGVLTKLGNAFVADSNNINQGYPILSWQTSSVSAEKNPSIKISGGNKLYMTNSGETPQITLTVQYVDMDDTPVIKWSVKDSNDAVMLEAPNNADSSNTTVIVKANKAGTATVVASAEDDTYTDEYEISVFPFVTTVEIDGTPVAGRRIKAKLNVLDGDEYDYDNYPEFSIQWKYLTNEGYTSGNTGSGSYKNINGATSRELEVPAELVGDYLSFTVSYNGEDKTPGRPVKIISEDEYQLNEDKAALEIDTSDVKANKTISLPSSGKNGSVITWSSSNSTVINPETGAVTLTESDNADVTLTATISKGGNELTKTFTIKVYSVQYVENETAELQNKERLKNAVASIGSYYKITPVFGTDTGVIDIVKSKLAENEYSDIEVYIKSIEQVYGGAGIENDGTITYFYVDPNTTPSIKMGRYNVTFTLTCGTASDDITVPVIIYWDADKVKQVMTTEILNNVTVDMENDVTENLSLPKIVDNKKWTQISWVSSNTDVISISTENQSTADTLFNPYIGVVKQGETDEQVTLTATFTFMLTNDVTGNEQPITMNKTFTVTVPAAEDEEIKAAREALEAKLNFGFEKAGLTDVVTGELLTSNNNVYTAYNDIQFPTTRDFGVDGKYYPVTIRSDNNAVIKSPDVKNAARTTVYRPAVGKADANANVTVSITDTSNNISVSKAFDITVPALTQSEIDAEKALMEKVKAAYFEGIKGENTDAGNISENLESFVEVYEENGSLVWVRNNSDRVNHGIIPVPMEEWEILEAWRLFKSSNPAVITHENLLVSMQNNAKAVTITSALSSETLGKYGELYKSNPTEYADYSELADLYYRPVSQEVVVRGTSTAEGEKPVSVTEKINVSFRLKNGEETLIAKTSYKDIDETSTVFDIFKKVLDENGYIYTNDGGYVSSVTTPNGNKLEELNEESETGWRYKVNGTTPDVCMSACGIEDGDDIIVLFGEDVPEVTSATVSASAALGESFIVNERELTVSSDEAEKFGYTDSLKEGVSALDVLVKMHEDTFGENFTAETATMYFNAPGGWINCVFGEETGSVGYNIDYAQASGLSAQVTDGGAFEFFFYQDLQYWSDVYTHISDVKAIAGEETTVNASYHGKPMVGAELATVDGLIIIPIDGAVADENGDIKVTFDEPGTYYVTLTGMFNHEVTTDWGTGATVLFDSPIVPSVTKVTVELPEALVLPDDIYAATSQTIKNTELTYGSEWAVMGLARAGVSVPDTYYESVINAVKNNSLEKVTDYERAIIALTSIGKKVDNSLLDKLLSASYVKNGGVMSSIYALIALDTADYEIPQNADSKDQNTRDIMIESILAHQKDDGGFSLSESKESTVDITAMAVEALAKYANKADVSESIAKALEFIDDNIDADVHNLPDKCASLAQIVVAYTALEKNPKTYVDKMLEYYDGKGQFKYEGAANASTTTQAYYALVSYYRWANDENSLYDMSDAFYDIVSYDGDACVIYAPFSGKAFVIGADYTDGALTNLDVSEKELLKGTNTINIHESDKIMLWNSLNGMQPLCEVYVR